MEDEQLPLLNTQSNSINLNILTDSSNIDNNIIQNSYISSEDDDNTVIMYESDNQSFTSNESGDKCRICLQNINKNIQYCNCLDALSNIHKKCLFSWLNNSCKIPVRNEEFDNHDIEYKQIYNIIKKNNNYELLNNIYYYCEICHYRYNIYLQHEKIKSYLFLVDTLLGLSLIGVTIYVIYLLRKIFVNYVNITLILNFIFLMISLIGTCCYSGYIKLHNYKFIIFPHHSKIINN